MKSLPFVQGAMTRDIFDPTAIGDKPLLSYLVSKFIHIKFRKGPLLGNMDLLGVRELELGPT